MPLFNWEVILILTWSSTCVVFNSTGPGRFAIWDTKRSVPIVTLSSFQGVNRLFILSFEHENGRTSHSEYCLPKAEIKTYNVKIDGKNVWINK